MKRYDSLRVLFWTLAAGLAVGAASAATGNVVASSNSGDTLVVGTDNYDDIANFSIDVSLNGLGVGTTGSTITLKPGSYTPDLTLSGTTATLSDNFTFDDQVNDGPITLKLAPNSGQTFTNTGTYISTRPADILQVAGEDATAVVILSGDLSNFQSHLKHTAGQMSLVSDNAVMTNANGGQITITSTAGNATLGHSSASRTVGSSAHIINIETGKTLTLTGPATVDGTVVQTVASQIAGAGTVAVSSGEHLLSGSPINNAGGLTISGGLLRLGGATGVGVVGTGGTVTLEGAGSYGGAFNLNNSTELVTNSAGTITLTGANASYTPSNITVRQGTVVLEESAIFTGAPYRSGTTSGAILQMNVASGTKTLTGGISEQNGGTLTLTKTGAGTLDITTAALNTTAPLNIQAGYLTTAAGMLGSNFLSETDSPINISSGASMRSTVGTSALTLARPLSGSGTLTFDVSNTNGLVTLSNANVDVATVELTGSPDTAFYLDISGGIPTADITTDNTNQRVRFTSASATGEYLGAITGDGSVTVASSADVTFSGASTFFGALNVAAGSQAHLNDAAIIAGRQYNVSGSGARLKFEPASPYTFSNPDVLNTGDSSATIEFLGGNTSDTEITISTAQPYTGAVELTSAYVNLTVANALSNAASITLANNSVLKVAGGVNQSLNNLTAISPNATLEFGAASVMTFFPTGTTQTFAGAIASASNSNAGIVMNANSTANQLLTGSLANFYGNITANPTATYNLQVQSPITLGPRTDNTYTAAANGALKFVRPSTTNIAASIQNDFNLDTALVDFNGIDMQYLPTATGSVKTITGTGGMRISGTAGITLNTDFGRRIVNGPAQGLVVASGPLVKSGYGILELQEALSTGYAATATAISVDAGKLRIVEDAIAGSAGDTNTLISDIVIAAQSSVELDVNDTNKTLSRVISGAGNLVVSNSNATAQRTLSLDATARILNKGDLTIGEDLHLQFNHADTIWQPGSAAKIAIQDGGGLSIAGTVTPDGGVFNPYFVTPGGTLHTVGNTTIAINSSRQSLVIGNSADSLQIDSGVNLNINLAAGKRAEIKYNLLALGYDSVLQLNTAGTLVLEGDVLDGFTGVVSNAPSAAGQLWLKNIAIDTNDPGTKFNFGHGSATTTFEISSGNDLTLGVNNTLQTSAGSVSKIGAGRLTFDATDGIANWSGDLNIKEGDVEFHNVARGDAHVTHVHNGARLVAWRDFGATSPSDMNLGALTLDSGSVLLLTERDWADNGAGTAATASHLSLAVIKELTTGAGAEIVFAINPAGGEDGMADMTFSSAMLQLDEDLSGGANNITAPLYIRVAPINGTDYTSGKVYSLIQFSDDTSASNVAAKIKLRPTIRGLASNERGYSVTNNTALTGQIALGRNSNTSEYKHLILQINASDIGFAPGLRASNQANYPVSYPVGTYTTSYYLEHLMGQNFAAYSALDGVLSAVMTHDRNLDYHMSLLAPTSYTQAASNWAQGDLFLQPYMEQGFNAVSEGQRWAQYAAHTGNGGDLANVFAVLGTHQNLSSDTKVQHRGNTHAWDSKVTGISFNDTQAAHQVDARVVGAAWRLSPHAAIGYQQINSKHHYKSLDSHTYGSKDSTAGQAFAYLSSGAFSVETLSSATLSEQDQKRHINVDVDTALVDKWVATSTSKTAELGTSLALAYRKEVAQNIGMEFGVKTKAQYAYTPRFEEKGADNLSLVLESQHHGYVLASPTLALDTRYMSNKVWFASRFTLGYQQVLSQHNDVSYGFKDIDARYHYQSEQSEAISGVLAGVQSCFATVHGLSLQLQYQTLLGQNHQGHVSVSYEF